MTQEATTKENSLMLTVNHLNLPQDISVLMSVDVLASCPKLNLNSEHVNTTSRI